MTGITPRQALALLRARLVVETLERHMDDDTNKTVQYRVGRVNMLADCIALVAKIDGAMPIAQEEAAPDFSEMPPSKMPDNFAAKGMELP